MPFFKPASRLKNAEGRGGVPTFERKGTWLLALNEVNKDRTDVHINNPNGSAAAVCRSRRRQTGYPLPRSISYVW